MPNKLSIYWTIQSSAFAVSKKSDRYRIRDGFTGFIDVRLSLCISYADSQKLVSLNTV